MIVFDASSLVGPAIGTDSVPRPALYKTRGQDRFALSKAVHAESVEVPHRPRLARFIDPALLNGSLDLFVPCAAWFESAERVTDCRDPKDNIYLELALAASASTMVSSDTDLLILGPWRSVEILRPLQYLGCPRLFSWLGGR